MPTHTTALASALVLCCSVGARAAEPPRVTAAVTVAVTDVDAPPKPKRPESTPERKVAEQLFATRCALCHGTVGRADGPMSRTLQPRPRAFADPKWQVSVDDTHITTIILGGGTSVKRSPIMPANPDLEDKPAVVKELVRVVRSFRLRGAVHVELLDAAGAVAAHEHVAPDDTGASARLTLHAPAGEYTLRAWLDVNENDNLDDGERNTERPYTVTATDGAVGLSLAPAAASDTPAAP